jgi:hypothetical protein
MAWTTHLETFLLSGLWQFAPASEAELYRFSIVSGDFSPSGIGRYEVGQFDANGSGYALKSYRTEPFGLIVPCPKPKFFETQRLGFRVPIGFNPFTLKIEVNDMPFSVIGNPQGAATSATSLVAASVTSVVIAPANPDRKMLSMLNTSSKSLYLDFDGDVTVTSYAVEVKANTLYEMPIGFVGEVKGIWATGATGNCKVTEFI